MKGCWMICGRRITYRRGRSLHRSCGGRIVKVGETGRGGRISFLCSPQTGETVHPDSTR